MDFLDALTSFFTVYTLNIIIKTRGLLDLQFHKLFEPSIYLPNEVLVVYISAHT